MVGVLNKLEKKSRDNAGSVLIGPVLFVLINQFTDVIGGIARHLRDSLGASAVLLHTVPLPNSQTYDLSPSDFVETIDCQPVLVPRPRTKLPPLPDLIERVEKAERRYRIRVLEMIRSDRHLGQDFSNGADTPRSRYARQFDYFQSVDLCLRLLEFFEDLVTRLRPSVIIISPGDTARMGLTAVAEAHGIPIRIPGPNYSNNAFQWRVNRFFWPGGLAEAYRQEKDSGVGSERRDHRAATVRESDRTEYARRVMNSGTSVPALLKPMFGVLKRQAGDIVKRRKRVYGGYQVPDALALIFSTWRERRRQIKARPLRDRLPKDQPYVFFPLVVEPESTLQCESPMCDNQLTLIDWLAKTLPGGWRLIVKEHPGFTYPRPRFFWDQIRRYPNVDIAAIYESGEGLAERARVVAVVNGTLGSQAAAGGVPVLTFNPNWWGRFLPHVAYAGNYEETAAALRDLSEEKKLPQLAERLRLGEALVRALDVNSVPLKDKRILEERALGEPTPYEDIAAMTAALLDSLTAPRSDAAIPFDRQGRGVDLATRSTGQC